MKKKRENAVFLHLTFLKKCAIIFVCQKYDLGILRPKNGFCAAPSRIYLRSNEEENS